MMVRNMAIMALTLLVAPSLPKVSAPAQGKPTIATFDPPGSADTLPESINSNGVVAGWYIDASNVEHGFVRAVDGTITTFDPSGSMSTLAMSINDSGAVVGSYKDGAYVQHGFLRTPDGTITTFDAADSGSTDPVSINGEGVIAGDYIDTNATTHGFVRATDGTVTLLDPPYSHGTYVLGINGNGATTGYFYHKKHSSRLVYGFVREAGGSTATFRVQHSPAYPASINSNGTAVGTYYPLERRWSAFIRNADGSSSVFKISTRTSAASVNDSGMITGQFLDAKAGMYRGYIRAADGTIKRFDPDGSTLTEPASINATGSITGWFIDSKNVEHGFVRTP